MPTSTASGSVNKRASFVLRSEGVESSQEKWKQKTWVCSVMKQKTKQIFLYEQEKERQREREENKNTRESNVLWAARVLSVR